MTRALQGLVFPHDDRTERPEGLRCHCGAFLDYPGPGLDYSCACGLEFNSAGQQLAPRDQWGEETGETAADYFRGQANPDRAFNED